jgi:hypothetical protein
MWDRCSPPATGFLGLCVTEQLARNDGCTTVANESTLKLMVRPVSGAHQTCESCKALDVWQWHRDDCLPPALRFSWKWTRGDMPSGDIPIRTDAIWLTYRVRRFGASEWKDIQQRVHLTWTKCHLGGRRPWLQCPISSNGKYCGRRVAKLHLAHELFACRRCSGLAYESQQESDPNPVFNKAQKIRIRLGGCGNITLPFPPKPKGMHWKTYDRLRLAHDQARRHG